MTGAAQEAGIALRGVQIPGARACAGGREDGDSGQGFLPIELG
jgi:hypothetical protein